MNTTISKIIAVLFLSTFATSCVIDGFNRIKGDRNVTVEKRNISKDYSKIKISNGLDVYITQGNKVSVTVEADENLHDVIKTEVRNGVLKIYSERNIWRAKAQKIYITTHPIEAIKATSGSDVYSENTLTGDNLEIETNSGADMSLRLNVHSVVSSSSSGSDLKLVGNATNYTAIATSGSSTKSYGLKSKNVTVKATSGADIDVYAIESINAKANSGGDVDYKGTPTINKNKASSGGSISAKDF